MLTGVVGALAGDGACTPTSLDGLADADDGLALLQASYIETGDLRQLRERGVLRVLVHRSQAPGPGAAEAHRARLLTELADDLGLEIAWISVGSWHGLVTALQAGQGDLIASELALTPESRAEVAFAAPTATSRLQVVVRDDTDDIRLPRHLAHHRVAVWPDSVAWDSMTWLQARHPDMLLEASGGGAHPLTLLGQVESGRADATVLPSHLIPPELLLERGLKVAFNLTSERSIAWAVRSESPLLLAAVDRHLATTTAYGADAEDEGGDLDAIDERGVLRVLSRPDPGTAYLSRGRIAGFEYDLLRAFAHDRGLAVEIVVPPSRADLPRWLQEGRGDVVAARLPLPEYESSDAFAWTRPYNFASQVVVSRANEPMIESPEELDGRVVAVPGQGALYNQLLALSAEFDLDLDLLPVPVDMPADERLARVADGTYDLTVVDSSLADIVLPWRPELRAGVAIGETSHSWMLRSEDIDLQAALDDYLDRTYRSTFYNLTYNRYHKARRHAPRWLRRKGGEPSLFTRWDRAVRYHADAQGFDWRLITAQMYEESRFRPWARSGRGAVGLMQLLPETMEELGVDDSGPEASIRAGAMYLAQMRRWLPETIAESERIWFALAAYNVGIGHLEDARALAEELGHDPDRWFGHVEEAMLKLAEAPHAARARYGYCQGSQPVDYVRSIRDRYLAYVRLARGHYPGAHWLVGLGALDATPTPDIRLN